MRQRSVNTGLQVLEDPPPPCIPPGIVLGIDFKLSIIGKHVIGPEEPRSCIVTYKDVHSVVSPGHQNGSHPSPGKDTGDPTEDPQPFGCIYSTKSQLYYNTAPNRNSWLKNPLSKLTLPHHVIRRDQNDRMSRKYIIPTSIFLPTDPQTSPNSRVPDTLKNHRC